MLTLCVKYIAKPGMAHAFVEGIERSGVATKIRAEKGCLKYDYYYPANREDEILLIEQWTEPEDQKVHMTQPHMNDLREIKHKYIAQAVLGDEALR